ncbi:MAG: 5-formyltetrahydrofolate cyclo-ligase [Treponema sp.]|nr:5-formyltetrahydrofolate cyclo-ligase [Candidatus Treponema equi]
MKSIVASLDPVGKAFESMSKCVGIIQSDMFRKADAIVGFMPMKDEVDILPVLRTGLQQNKKVILPKIIDGTNDMDFYYITDEPNQQTESNSWGVYEPKAELEKCDMDELLSSITDGKILVLVPGLAFGQGGTRLGRGKGFYDKFLSGLKKRAAEMGKEEVPLFCGISYKAQQIDSVPVDENDVLVDIVI